MSAYYNEIDPFAAEWLRELIKAGMIAPGEVDERSIEDVLPADIRGFSQHHFFAGIGVWSYALRQAGWPDDRPVWTGSCPCQPFSAAGKGAGFADERHLWPSFFHLIEQCRPPVVFGEQVASKAVEPWIDLVQADLEAVGYAFGCVPFPAASVGAPHIRDRAYWVADAKFKRQQQLTSSAREGAGIFIETAKPKECLQPVGGCSTGSLPLADSSSERLEGSDQRAVGGQRQTVERSCCAFGLADDYSPGLQPWERDDQTERYGHTVATKSVTDRNGGTCQTNGFWRDADWLFCRDGKWRPVSASPQPMVDWSAESLGRVCDACVREVEEEISATAMEAEVNPDEAMRELWQNLVAEALPKWPAGRMPGLHEAPFLLSFLRQLAEQGWRFKECASVSCEETSQESLRVLRSEHGTSCPPHRCELAQQLSGKYPDTLCVLSSILARHAHKAWDYAHKAYAESCFPLVHGAATNRVGRLRGYGNAIVAQQAKAFIEVFMEITK